MGVTFSSPHSFHSGAGSQRPGAVKGARFLARRSATLDGEDRCETITEGRKEPLSNSAYPLQSPNSQKLIAGVAEKRFALAKTDTHDRRCHVVNNVRDGKIDSIGGKGAER